MQYFAIAPPDIFSGDDIDIPFDASNDFSSEFESYDKIIDVTGICAVLFDVWFVGVMSIGTWSRVGIGSVTGFGGVGF